MKTPDITPAQIVALIGSVLGVLAAFGVPMSKEKQDAIIDLVTVLAPVLLTSNTVLRVARNYRLAKVEMAKAILPES